MADELSRRAMLGAIGVGAVGTLAACDNVELPGVDRRSNASVPRRAGAKPKRLPSAGTEFRYRVRYTDEEWRARLTPDEYSVLREASTEPRNSHYLTRFTDPGTYLCQGCELPIYDSSQKVILDKGWVFFKHAITDSVLLGDDEGKVEVHCRRCGSHMGHIFFVETEILHCINGTSLEFKSV